jgi:ribosomal protein S18 acetylase RimI-like enzyme
VPEPPSTDRAARALAPEIEIVRGREELLGDVRRLWLALRDHHHAIAPDLGPVHDDATSWARRRDQYQEWLLDERTFILLARRHGTALAYAMVRVVPRSSPTWVAEQQTLELETLSVLPEARNTGIGAALLDRVRDEVDRGGYDGLFLVALAANRDAVRFYEREGLTPTFVTFRDTRRRP